jgi:hypothetical protein
MLPLQVSTNPHHHQKIARFFSYHTIATKFSLPDISLNTWGILFRKVSYTRYDVASEMFQTSCRCK